MTRYFILLSLLIVIASSVKLDCKKKGFECKINHLEIVERNVLIEQLNGIDDNDDMTSLRIENTVVNFLPSNIGIFFRVLTELEVTKSQLSEINKSDFDGLDGLTTVDLSQNKIQELKFDVFEDLKELKVLNLDDNQISKLPSTIFKSNIQLIEIVLSHNQISKISSETFNNLVNLQKLYLNDNQLTSLNSDTFSIIKKLSILSIANNKLNLIPDDIFDDLNLTIQSKYFTNNECIDKYDKEINSIDDLKAALSKHCMPEGQHEMNKLKKDNKKLIDENNELKSKVNQLESNIEDFQKPNSELEQKNNEIKILESANGQLKYELENLNNQMKYLSSEKDQADDQLKEKIKNLKEEKERCDELNSKINELNTKINENNDALDICMKESLDLTESIAEANETISHLNETIQSHKGKVPFDLTCESKTLNHTQNGIVTNAFDGCSIEKRSNLKNSLSLQIHGDSNSTGLLLSEVFMIDFPMEIFTTFTQIKYAKIVNSAFGSLDNAFCSSSMNIEYLTIEKSYFGEKLKLSSCSKLKYLKIESTNMEVIKIEGEIPTLVEMLLRNNKIKSIPSDFFGKFINLENLQMTGNKITTLNAEMFDKNKKLEVINFADNPITRIDGEIFENNKMLIKLDFTNAACISKSVGSKNLENFKKDLIENCKAE